MTLHNYTHTFCFGLFFTPLGGGFPDVQ